MKTLRLRRSKKHAASRRSKKLLNRLVDHRLHEQVCYEDYREKVRGVYDGPKGKLLMAASRLSLHLPLGERLLKRRHFDLGGVRNILDVGSGAGQLAQHLVKYCDPGTRITCIDISRAMLRLARRRVSSRVPVYAIADLARLPFADESFDCVTCGYVLEHMPDPRTGLAEMQRVMTPGAAMLLFTSEQSFGGAWTSRFWCCRTYDRGELKRIAAEEGFDWVKELWFSPVHRLLRAGGICGVLVKRSR